jgi:predicted Zn finger-like uncharacterized protein
MSLATRCMHCGTVFRVVEDQLKVSEGWVRCGRCGEVFNAVEGLFDLDREPPPEWIPPNPNAAPPLPAPAPEPPPPPRDPFLVERLDAELVARRRPGVGGEASTFGYEPAAPEAAGPASPAAAVAAPAAAEPAVEPEFVRRARQDDHWRRSPHRAALAVTVVVLLLLLSLQLVVHQRDHVAARVPAAAPALAALCDVLGCRIEPPRRIDAIAVESSALARTPTPDVFRLSVTLRNRDTVALLLPSIELALTDASGGLVARRVLAPADFRVAAPVIAAGAEQTLSLPLTAGAGKVSGYTVEIFYP